MPKPLLLGHRGARNYAPENTFDAFDLALQHGCDGFEFDVRLTADGHAVIFHDATLEECEVDESSYCSLLDAYPQLPTLEQVFQRFSHRAFMNAELKVAGLESRVAEVLHRFPTPHGILISSFLPEVVSTMHDRSPHAELGFICRDPKLLDLWRKLPITWAVLNFKLVTPDLCNKIHEAGRKVLVWTLNNKQQLQEFNAMGVDGIISDDTRLLAEVLRGDVPFVL